MWQSNGLYNLILQVSETINIVMFRTDRVTNFGFKSLNVLRLKRLFFLPFSHSGCSIVLGVL